MNYPQLSPEASRQLRAEALPVLDAFILTDTPFPESEMVQSTLWFDLSNRPDVSDLARVQRHEPGGCCILTWMVEAIDQILATTFYLQVQMHTPVQARFVLSFSMPQWYLLIETLARSGSFSVCEGPAPEWRSALNRTGLDREKLASLMRDLSGPGLQISMARDTHECLREIYSEWERNWQQFLQQIWRCL